MTFLEAADICGMIRDNPARVDPPDRFLSDFGYSEDWFDDDNDDESTVEETDNEC